MNNKWLNAFRITPPDAHYDRTLLVIVLALYSMGFLLVNSASYHTAEAFPMLLKSALSSGVALLVLFMSMAMNIEKLRSHAACLYILIWIVLIGVAIKGAEINGARRWISLGGFQIQPSEFARLTLIVYLAYLLTELRQKNQMIIKTGRIFRDMFPVLRNMLPVITVLLLYGLVVLGGQSDLGSMIVFMAIVGMSLIFIGLSWRVIGSAVVVAVIGIAIFIAIEPYRWERAQAFTDPFKDYHGDGYQMSNSLMAFARGGFNGAGLGNSVQKLGYLPEAHTDFIMSIAGEELGFMGVAVLFLLAMTLVVKIYRIARRALVYPDLEYHGLVAFGIAVWFFVQTYINLGMAVSALPTKGLTFPFVSYGGSSMVAMSMAIGIVLRIDYEVRRKSIGGAVRKKMRG